MYISASEPTVNEIIMADNPVSALRRALPLPYFNAASRGLIPFWSLLACLACISLIDQACKAERDGWSLDQIYNLPPGDKRFQTVMHKPSHLLSVEEGKSTIEDERFTHCKSSGVNTKDFLISR